MLDRVFYDVMRLTLHSSGFFPWIWSSADHRDSTAPWVTIDEISSTDCSAYRGPGCSQVWTCSPTLGHWQSVALAQHQAEPASGRSSPIRTARHENSS